MIDTARAAKLQMLRRTALRVRGGDLSGCCAAMSLIVQQVAGGTLLTGTVNGFPHVWNRLPDGTEVDLTSCQFGGDGFTPLAHGEPCERPELIDPEHLLFAAAVYHDLHGEPVA